MTIQTRNKRKNWQAELGTNAHKVFCQRSLSGLSVPVKWALRDQVMGIDRPSYGHSLPVLRASSAQSVGRFLGTFCGSATSLLCMMLYEDFVMLLCWFGGTTMPISWYFYHIYDTSMILFCKIIKKYHSYILLCIRQLHLFLIRKMILWDFFHEKTFFVCV